jgi:hypothetical protein
VLIENNICLLYFNGNVKVHAFLVKSPPFGEGKRGPPLPTPLARQPSQTDTRCSSVRYISRTSPFPWATFPKRLQKLKAPFKYRLLLLGVAIKANFGLFCVIFHSSRLNISKLAFIKCLKCIIKCLYEFVFKFCQFLDSKLPYLLNYGRFYDFDPSGSSYWLFCVTFRSLRLNKSDLTYIECLKCIIICLYQFVLKFFQFLDPTLPICWISADFVILTPLRAIFWLFCVIFHSSRLHKSKLASIECSKCIIKCLYRFIFKFCQFLDSKLPYLLNCGRFYDFDPSRAYLLIILRYFSHFEAE